MKKVFVVGEAVNYASFIKDSQVIDDMKEADIVLFTGGEDVNPALYKAKPHPTTFFSKERDRKEVSVFKKIKPTQLALGICRGSQFLCVMNGGKLVQNCLNHAIYGTHGITNGEVEYEITSTHHQMQYPYNLNSSDFDILWVSTHQRSMGVYEGDGVNLQKINEGGEPEVVVYHKEGMPKCLAIQGHPEYMRAEAPVVEMLNNLIDETLKSIKK